MLLRTWLRFAAGSVGEFTAGYCLPITTENLDRKPIDEDVQPHETILGRQRSNSSTWRQFAIWERLAETHLGGLGPI
jgi:hypothetical protein